MFRAAGIVCLVIIFCIAGAIGYYNLTPVVFDYLVGTVQIQLVLLLLIVFAAAVVITLLSCGYRLLGQRREIHRLRRRLRATDAELKNLRTLPLKEA